MSVFSCVNTLVKALLFKQSVRTEEQMEAQFISKLFFLFWILPKL